MNKNKKGFTLVELVITIVVVGVLSIISVNAYRGFVKKAILTEGKTLVGAIAQAQRLYYAQHKRFYSCWNGEWNFCQELDIDARSNKYFRGFTAYPIYAVRSMSRSGQQNAPQKRNYVPEQDRCHIQAYYYHDGDLAWIVSIMLYADGTVRDLGVSEEHWGWTV